MRRTLTFLPAAALIGGTLVLATPPTASAAPQVIAPTPDRVIAGAATGMQRPVGLALGPDGRLFVSNLFATPTPGSVRVFAPAADGNVPAVAVLDPTSPGMGFLTKPAGIAVGSDGRLHMAAYNDNAIRTFTVPATGNGFALQSAIGAATLIAAPNDLALTSPTSLWVASGTTDEVVRLDVGSTTRRRTLHTPAPMGLAVHGTSLYVSGGNGTAPYVKVFTAGTSGPATPSRTISGPATGLDNVWGLAVDRYGRTYVANGGDSSIRVFAAGATGNVAPIVVLEGAATQLELPSDVLLDGAGRIWVANDTVPGKVLRFPALAAPPPPAPRPPVTTPPTTAPSKPRALKVTGKTAARKRVVRWKAPARSGGARILRYRVVVNKGKKTLLVRTVSASRRKVVVKRAKLRNGKHTVLVRAVNAKGGSPYATKRFRVRR
ncbi:hypothetical protein [Mumia sp. Pv 4-285]|uniref:hypothetical protein n=1 Tax=Mumia qirimensis TaxID=3234852 RepID=UPI00351CECBD